jgi:hypothetical protein
MIAFVITWIDIDGTEYEKIVYAENIGKAKYKAFKVMRDEDGIFEKYAKFETFIKYYFKSAKSYVLEKNSK